jgi:hypothetical protein
MKTKPKAVKLPMLPLGIELSDFKRPDWDDKKDKLIEPYQDSEFEMWYTERFGWCIPTLLIGRGRGGYQDRTYAYSLKTEGTVRIGRGPHVLHTVTVYVRKTREKALRPYLEKRSQGAGMAGDIRDRISTRRALTAQRRASYGGLW